MSTETYSISGDFSNGVDPGSLQSEIEANTTITTVVNQVESVGDNCNINFVSAISGAEKTELDSVVAAHDPLPTSSAVIVVAKDGNGDYTTIAAALTDANSRATSGIRCCVLVYPGTYVEANPMTVGEGVSIIGRGSYLQCVVAPTDPNTHIMELHTRGMIEGLSFYGAAGPSGKAIYYNGTGGTATTSLALIRECGVQYCYTGIYAAGGRTTNNNSLTIQTLGIKTNPSQGVTTGILVEDDTEVLAVNYRTFSNDTTPLGTAVKVDGPDAHCLLTDSIIDGGTVGIHNTNDSQCEIRSTHIRGVGTGVIIDSTQTSTEITTSKIESSVYDVDIQATSANNIAIIASDMNLLNINNPNQLGITGVIYDDEFGDNGVRIMGELSVGSITHPAEAVFGSGDSYTHSMSVQTNDNLEAGTWTDHTSSAKDEGVNTFSAFAGVSAGNCLYIGSDFKFYGLKMHMSTTAITSGEYENIVLEYYDGTSWTEVKCMWSEADAPYYTHAEHHFESDSMIYQVRFNSTMVWGAQYTCNSTTKYWCRFRITSALTTNPTLDKIKVHSCRTEINKDGYIEYFGNGRPVVIMPWDIKQFYHSPSISNAGNQDLYISDNIGVALEKNSFGTAGEQSITYMGFVPPNMDTSSGIRCVVAFVCPDTNAGNIRWLARWGFSDGDSWKVYTNTTDAPTSAPKEFSAATVVAAPGVANKVTYMTIVLDVHDLSSNPDTGYDTPTIGWMSLSRTPTHADDTYGSTVNIVNMQSTYLQWANGSHNSIL